VSVRLIALTAVAIALLCASPAQAGPEDVAARISNEVMSPFCDGVTLHDCPSAEADELRRRIAAWARAGMPEDAILARLTREYDIERAAPDDPAAWLLPVLAGVGGVAAVTALAIRWTRRTPVKPAEPSPEDRARIEAELGAYRGGS
jgi:cytochrome c-type biogenesis protein CcmH/NrfF